MRGDMVEEVMLVDDLEGLLREIEEFSSRGGSKDDIPESLNRYLQYVAKSGNVIFPWYHVRLLFRNKILQALDQFPGEICPNSESFVMERFDLFRSAPFTIQRLAELITQPTRHYKKKDKFLRGLEKTVLVVSTVEPWSVDQDMANGNGGGDQGYEESEESEMEDVNRTFGIDGGYTDEARENVHGDGNAEGEEGGLASIEPTLEKTQDGPDPHVPHENAITLQTMEQLPPEEKGEVEVEQAEQMNPAEIIEPTSASDKEMEDASEASIIIASDNTKIALEDAGEVQNQVPPSETSTLTNVEGTPEVPKQEESKAQEKFENIAEEGSVATSASMEPEPEQKSDS